MILAINQGNVFFLGHKICCTSAFVIRAWFAKLLYNSDCTRIRTYKISHVNVFSNFIENLQFDDFAH